MKPPAGAAAVREEFKRAGISLTEWAKAQGFKRMTVVDVLRGHRRGDRGEAHLVAIALGLKDGQVIAAKQFKPGTHPAAVASGGAR